MGAWANGIPVNTVTPSFWLPARVSLLIIKVGAGVEAVATQKFAHSDIAAATSINGVVFSIVIKLVYGGS
jgi:hypothetical protein